MLQRAAQRAVPRRQGGQGLAARLAGLQVPLGRGALAAPERAVGQGAQLRFGQVRHGASPVRACRRRRSSARARDRRDITVPTGTFSTRAISS